MKTLFFSILILFTFGLSAQNTEADILQVAKQLFVAMETNDSTLAASLFVEDAQLHTVFKNKDGKTQLANMPASKLVSAFAKPKDQTWREPIWNEKIHIDGDFATLWVDYAFYVDDTFMHCGVDAFQMIRKEGKWKIFSITDTRRKEGCEVPNE
ncbi:MAG: nuclear transport factor 2 family protein [Cyclobacteriaceae bacterium]